MKTTSIRRHLSLLLVLTLVLSVLVLPGTVQAADSGSCGSNARWTLSSSGVLTISGSGAMYDYGEYNDTRSPWYNNTGVKSVVIEPGITHIGAYAFYYGKMSAVSIPSTVSSIGEGAFYCSNITSVTIPEGVKVIPEHAIAICHYLTSISLPSTLKQIDGWAFCFDHALERITIPNGVTAIGYRAFWGCEKLTSVTVPASVTDMDRQIFYECPDDLTIYGSYGSAAESYASSYDINFSGSGSAPSSGHTHSLEYIPEEPPTCTESGVEGHYYCAGCGKYFRDNAGRSETTLDQLTLPPTGHHFVDGVCTVCGETDPNYDDGDDWNDYSGEPTEVHFAKVNTYRDDFADVGTQWYRSVVAESYELGLMKGKNSSRFDPTGNVTLAEAVTMAARIHSIYTTGAENFVEPAGKWYQGYLDYAYENGIISATVYNGNVSRQATRAEFAEIFARALPANALPAINSISAGAIPDVSSYASYGSYVYTLYRAGVLTGSDSKGTFKPDTNISRAESAAIVARMAESNNRVYFSLG